MKKSNYKKGYWVAKANVNSPEKQQNYGKLGGLVGGGVGAMVGTVATLAWKHCTFSKFCQLFFKILSTFRVIFNSSKMNFNICQFSKLHLNSICFQ